MKFTFMLVVIIGIFLITGCGEKSVTTPDPRGKSTYPHDFAGTFDGEKINLTWNKSDLGTETGYEIWRKDDGKGEFVLIWQTDANTFEFADTDVAGNNTYQYRAKCTFPVLIGDFSESIDVSTNFQSPMFLELACDGSAIVSSWIPDSYSEPTGYEVWRSVGDGSNYQLLGETVSGETSYHDTEVVLGNRYYYKVRAKYSLGESDFCDELDIKLTEYTYAGKWQIHDGISTPGAIGSAPNGNIYVSCNDSNYISYYSSKGAFLGDWAHSGVFSSGIAVSLDGSKVYVSETEEDRVGVYSSNGIFSHYLGTGNSGSGSGDFDGPIEIAVAPNGNVYVVDAVNNRVQYFTSDGIYIGQWGEYGTFNGQFNSPAGIDVAPNGDVYVCEYMGSRVQYFTATGGFLGGWGSLGKDEVYFFYPTSVAISPLNNDVFVAQPDKARYFSSTGTYKGRIGHPDDYMQGHFGLARGNCLSPSGDTVYLIDYAGKTILYFAKFEG